jgi:hypothetical protein
VNVFALVGGDLVFVVTVKGFHTVVVQLRPWREEFGSRLVPSMLYGECYLIDSG